MGKHYRWLLIGMGMYAFGWFLFFALPSPLNIASFSPILSGLVISIDCYKKVKQEIKWKKK